MAGVEEEKPGHRKALVRASGQGSNREAGIWQGGVGVRKQKAGEGKGEVENMTGSGKTGVGVCVQEETAGR